MTVEQRYRALLTSVRTQHDDPTLAAWATHIYKVTLNYWRGLFHCYDGSDMPRTNNDLEQYFGAARHHERRATGHKQPTSAVVVRGTVRVIAAVAARSTPWTAQDLRLGNVTDWRRLRADLELRHATRQSAHRFRRDAETYLAHLEAQVLQISLPL